MRLIKYINVNLITKEGNPGFRSRQAKQAGSIRDACLLRLAVHRLPLAQATLLKSLY